MFAKLVPLLIFFVVLAVACSFRHVRSGTAIVVFRLEEPHHWRGPGLRWVIPGFERSEVCSIEPEAWHCDVRCYGLDRTEMSVRVTVHYDVTDPIKFHLMSHLIEQRIADAVSRATTTVVAAQPVCLVIAHPGLAADEIAQSVGHELRPVGIRLLDLQLRPPRLTPAISAALTAEIEARLRRGARLIEAETAAAVRVFEMRVDIAEFREMLRMSGAMTEQAFRVYEARSQRVAAERGNIVVLVPAPALPTPPHSPLIHAPNVTSMGAWRGKDGTA